MVFHWRLSDSKSPEVFLLETKWEQISLSLKGSSQHSEQSQQCCSLDGLDSFSDFQLLQSHFQRSKRAH